MDYSGDGSDVLTETPLDDAADEADNLAAIFDADCSVRDAVNYDGRPATDTRWRVITVKCVGGRWELGACRFLDSCNGLT